MGTGEENTPELTELHYKKINFTKREMHSTDNSSDSDLMLFLERVQILKIFEEKDTREFLTNPIMKLK